MYTALLVLQSSTHGETLTLQHQPSEHVLTQACLAAPSLGAIAEHEQIAAHPGSPPSRAYSPFPATSGTIPLLQPFLVVLCLLPVSQGSMYNGCVCVCVLCFMCCVYLD